jgi:hypothetical protein
MRKEDPSELPLALASNEQLIRELLARTTFAGVVCWALKNITTPDRVDDAAQVAYSANFSLEGAVEMLEQAASHLRTLKRDQV